jgi:hypothetical protein
MEDPYSSHLERDSNGTVLAEVFSFSEFAMGAEPVVIVTRYPINGVDRFYTTNGAVSRAPDDSCYYIRDACTVLRIDLATSGVTHWTNVIKLSGGGIFQTESSDQRLLNLGWQV